MIGSRIPDDERVNVEVVAAEAQRAVNEIINSAVNAVHDRILAFFIFPLGDT
jgi:L-asparagine transporter-like permease